MTGQARVSIKKAKKNPVKTNTAAAGTGIRLATDLFTVMAGLVPAISISIDAYAFERGPLHRHHISP
jgi:hypothetical protein